MVTVSERQNSRRRTIRNSRWTTGFDILKGQDLETRINSANQGKGVRTKRHYAVEPNRKVFTGMGVLQSGKYKAPVFQTSDGEWYVIQVSEAVEDTGKLFDGILEDQDTSIRGTIKRIAAAITGKRSIPMDDGRMSYQSNQPIDLEKALKLRRKHAPVYAGTTTDFTSGFLRRTKPLGATITTDGTVQIAGIITMSPDNSRALVNYFLNSKNQPPATIRRKKLPAEDKPTLPKKEAVAPAKKPETGEYSGLITPREPVKGATETTHYARKMLRAQETTVFEDTLPMALGDALEDVLRGDFTVEQVTAKIGHVERREIQDTKGRKSKMWLAYENEGKGFYVILPPAAEVVELDHRGNGRVNEITPPRQLSDVLSYWPNEEAKPGQVSKDDLWRLDVNSDLVITGYVARQTCEVLHDKTRLLGVAGMRRTTWRAMHVKKTVDLIVEEEERKPGGSNRITAGLDEEYVRTKARAHYESSEAVQSAATGGAEQFVTSVIQEMGKREVSLSRSRSTVDYIK